MDQDKFRKELLDALKKDKEIREEIVRIIIEAISKNILGFRGFLN